MPGFSPKLPLAIDSLDGIALTKTIGELAKQNLKMLVLTNPGERVMIPEFGSGIRRLLFENPDGKLDSTIRSRIFQQVDRYMPYIKISGIKIFPATDAQNHNQDFHTLSVIINYTVDNFGITDFLKLDLSAAQL
tara:strand:- start:1646 stop:2047 length:402 start_codon:yes stop_codon:yes gene_type:complete